MFKKLYLARSQIWLNLPTDDHHFGYIASQNRPLRKRKRHVFSFLIKRRPPRFCWQLGCSLFWTRWVLFFKPTVTEPLTNHGNTCRVLTAHNRTDNLNFIHKTIPGPQLELPFQSPMKSSTKGWHLRGGGWSTYTRSRTGLITRGKKKRIKEKVSVTFKTSTRGPIVTWFGRWHCASREDLQSILLDPIPGPRSWHLVCWFFLETF